MKGDRFFLDETMRCHIETHSTQYALSDSAVMTIRRFSIELTALSSYTNKRAEGRIVHERNELASTHPGEQGAWAEGLQSPHSLRSFTSNNPKR